MCGIIGYCGNEEATNILVEGLSALEYRGYDSSGIAIFNDSGIEVIKAVGKLENMKALLAKRGTAIATHCGIGHTRWATHGKPSDENAHPHSTDLVSLVHNGIIENYAELKEKLVSEDGYSFLSETDTEVAAKLFDKFYRITKDPFSAISMALGEIRGSYAFGIMFKDYPNTVFATRKDSPLICATHNDGNFIASDIPAVLRRTNQYYMMEQGELAVVQKDKIEFFDLSHNPISKELKVADWDLEAAEKGNFDHFMIKEIHEEPTVIRRTVSPRMADNGVDLRIPGLTDEILNSVRRIIFVACGTAMHAGMIGKAVIEQMARIPVNVEIASEFRYADPVLYPDDLVVVISQSGETADTLAALRLAMEKGCKTLAVVNVVGSSISREADFVLYTWAGPEIAVASTKAYSVQVSAMYLLALKFAQIKASVPQSEICALSDLLLNKMPELVGGIIERCPEIKEISAELMEAEDVFFIGRGLDYALSMEGSLKLKEISYIHSEAYAAGELKHGTISLITDGVPVIALATNDACYEKMISNIKEVRARGANVFLICKEDAPGYEEVSDFCFKLPRTDEKFMPLLAVAVLQIFAYYVSLLRGCDVDKPRNLAKSVTVE